MKNKYDVHKDFEYAKYVQAPMNPLGAEAINVLNMRAIEKLDFGEDVIIVKHQVVSPDGTKLTIRLIRPAESKGLLPCIINFNGGGFMLKMSPLGMKNLVEYAQRINCMVVAVDYRVGLSNPFPKGFEDGYAAFKWVYDHGETYGIDVEKLVIAGQSAGGALAAGICQKARDIGGPKIMLQLLIYPVTDSTLSQPSMKLYHDSPVWDAEKNKKMWRRYLENGYGEKIGYASPLSGEDFTNLPRAYIEVAEFDCLRDEGIAYGEALAEAGVTVETHMLEGGVHGYDNFIDSAHVDTFVDLRIDLLKKIFWDEDGR